MKQALVILSALGIFFLNYEKVACQNPPVARVENIVDEHFGVKVNDPYRYMENLAAPEVEKWIRDQADYTANILSNLYFPL